MNAAELRAGNYLQGEPLKIPRKSVTSDGIIEITTVGILQISQGYDLGLKPIGLNEKWLKEFGFKHREPAFDSYPNHSYWVNNGVILFYNESDDRNCYLLGYAEMRMGKYYAVGFRWIQDVHDLQNGFYIMKGKELIRNK